MLWEFQKFPENIGIANITDKEILIGKGVMVDSFFPRKIGNIIGSYSAYN